MTPHNFKILELEILQGIRLLQSPSLSLPGYLKRKNDSPHNYILDLSDENLSANQQLQLVRVLTKENKQNPTTSILACAKIKLKENTQFHPWFQELVRVNQQIADDINFQQKKVDYLNAYFSKFRWVTLGPAILIGLVMLAIVVSIFSLGVTAILALPAFPVLGFLAAGFITVYVSGSLPEVFENLLNQWVDKTNNGIATEFRQAALAYNSNPLANVENKQPIELGEANLNSQSYCFVLQPVASKKPERPSTVKLQLIGDNSEKIKVEQYDCKWVHPLFPKNPQGYYHRGNGNFELRVDGNVIPTNRNS